MPLFLCNSVVSTQQLLCWHCVGAWGDVAPLSLYFNNSLALGRGCCFYATEGSIKLVGINIVRRGTVVFLQHFIAGRYSVVFTQQYYKETML